MQSVLSYILGTGVKWIFGFLVYVWQIIPPDLRPKQAGLEETWTRTQNPKFTAKCDYRKDANWIMCFWPRTNKRMEIRQNDSKLQGKCFPGLFDYLMKMSVDISKWTQHLLISHPHNMWQWQSYPSFFYSYYNYSNHNLTQKFNCLIERTTRMLWAAFGQLIWSSDLHNKSF